MIFRYCIVPFLVFSSMVANPQLLNVQCNTVEQMGLENTLCRAYYTGNV